MQDDGFSGLSTVAVLLFTTHEQSHPLLRPEYAPNAENGSRATSRLMAHVPTTVRLDEVGERVGAFTPTEMGDVDRLLILPLGFMRLIR